MLRGGFVSQLREQLRIRRERFGFQCIGYSIHTDKENKTAELEKRGPGLYRLIPSISYMFKF